MSTSTPGTQPPLGLTVFQSLRAEDEPWLDQCYVAPVDFPLMSGWRSALVFGDAGSGKTALQLALERQWCAPDQTPPLLLVRWPILPHLASEFSGTRLVLEQIRQIFSVVAQAVFSHLAQYPAAWPTAPEWSQRSLTWFVQRHYLGDLAHAVASQGDSSTTEGRAVLADIAGASVSDILYPGTPTPIIVAELVRALQSLGLQGVRVLVGELEPWVVADVQQLVAFLDPFLSALALFEHPRFAYTLLLPAALQSSLWSAGAVVRRRASAFSLRAEPEHLQLIIERRLALALGETHFVLAQLGPEKELQEWLSRCGGSSPRGWIESVRPYYVAYTLERDKNAQAKPLTKRQCLDVLKRWPPRMVIDQESGAVTVGWREAPPLQTGQQVLLRYLYDHRGQMCLRREVYRAYLQGTERSPGELEFQKDFAGILDNAIYRLRQVLEPDPAHPVFIKTVKGEGYRLDNAW